MSHTLVYIVTSLYHNIFDHKLCFFSIAFSDPCNLEEGLVRCMLYSEKIKV
jgi:hypothetical protein